MPTTTATTLPTSDSVKDIATGTVDFPFTAGSVGMPDTFTFNINSVTSAETAMVNTRAGLREADAFVDITLEISTFELLTTPGAVFSFPVLPGLDDPTTESIFTDFERVSSGVSTVGFTVPGIELPDIPLELNSPGDFFKYTLTYGIVPPLRKRSGGELFD